MSFRALKENSNPPALGVCGGAHKVFPLARQLRLRKKDREFKASLSYMERPCLEETSKNETNKQIKRLLPTDKSKSRTIQLHSCPVLYSVGRRFSHFLF